MVCEYVRHNETFWYRQHSYSIYAPKMCLCSCMFVHLVYTRKNSAVNKTVADLMMAYLIMHLDQWNFFIYLQQLDAFQLKWMSMSFYFSKGPGILSGKMIRCFACKQQRVVYVLKSIICVFMHKISCQNNSIPVSIFSSWRKTISLVWICYTNWIDFKLRFPL